MDSCKVDPETFGMLCFMGSRAREEWNEDRHAPKKQKVNKEGMPVWRVQLASTNWRNRPEMLAITVAAATNPAEAMTVGEPVEVDGLVFGVSPKNSGNGYTTWLSADAVRSVAHVGAATA